MKIRILAIVFVLAACSALFLAAQTKKLGREVAIPKHLQDGEEFEVSTRELIAFGEDAIHIVNGKVVMRLHGPMRIDGDLPASVTAGQIILQSEGAEVFYRDIAIRPITAIPPEFAAR